MMHSIESKFLQAGLLGGLLLALAGTAMAQVDLSPIGRANVTKAKPAPAAAPPTASAPTAGAPDGKQVVQSNCAACHQTGVMQAPRLGNNEDWAPRMAKGKDKLLENAIKGVNGMPPKGGNATLSDAAVTAAVEHMLSLVDAGAATTAAAAPAVAVPVPAAVATGSKVLTDNGNGEKTYQASCSGCHASGVLGAPKLGIEQDWAARVRQGQGTLLKHALDGFRNMPARGGNPSLADADIEAAVAYMIAEVGVKVVKAEPKAAPAPAPKPAAAAPKPRVSSARANSFNRLMRPPSQRNPPPAEDGIHDPENDGTYMLQAPREAFSALPKAPSGNRIDWVQSLSDGAINPRYDRLDPDKQPVVMDLNIVREVKGSMPNVVYPHKQHTEWLDCSNCHPAIFIPQKGANQISMAAILLGQKCGVCHGKVAFPVSECRKCHSQKKPRNTAANQ